MPRKKKEKVKVKEKGKEIDPFFTREALKYKKPIVSREFILKHLEKLGVPVRYANLLKSFKLRGKKSQEALRRRLNAMIRDGQLLTDRKGRYALVKQMGMLRGYVICHRDGYGFLVPDDGGSDIFLNPRQIKSLFPGDRVLVRVTSRKGQSKREGVIVEILERSLTNVAGRYFVEQGVSFITPINKNISQEIIIPAGKEFGAKKGQFVVAKIINYPTSHTTATGQITKILGKNVVPGLEIEMVINAHGLPYVWPDEVLKESEAALKLKPSDKNRQQLQDLSFVTIDGEDAKDFDDAVLCQPHKNGGWVLYVAIADVSQYVEFDKALDREAFNRGNSVYFPDYVIPMLPESLSNDICSLKPNLERLVMVCEMRINETGKITRYKFYEGVIKSHARFTYDEVFDLLENKAAKSSPLLPQLKELKKLYRILLKQRQFRGALDFSRVEAQIIFNKKRRIQEIKSVQRHYVYGIIEECMLAANVCASKFLLQEKIPALYRVHDAPDAEKIYNLRNFLKGLGLELKGADNPKAMHYADILKKIVGRSDEHLVQIVLLRSLRQAVYTADNIGHFGLAYDTYLHFTSPIRRYPDLINHRSIKHRLQGGKAKDYYYTKSFIQNFGNHCSLTERRADDASRDVTMWLKCEFMKDKVGEVFDGIISGVANFGIFVELKDIFVEGLVHITSLKNDYYTFDSMHHKLIGKRGGKVYRLGDKIKVLLAKVDLNEREINFELVS